MAISQYVDISSKQTVTDWSALKAWSAQWDGVSRISIKVSEGAGVVNPGSHYDQALAHAFDIILPYHYARPDLNPFWVGAQKEADYFWQALAGRLREQDIAMLDYEGYPGKSNLLFPADWCWDWCHLLSGNHAIPANRVAIYSYDAFIKQMLRNYPTLADWLLIYANYNTFSNQPPSPQPWQTKGYIAWQFTSTGRVPGITEIVDINRWYGVPELTPDPTQQAIALLEQSITLSSQALGILKG